jgi:hypothetical protein
VGDDVWLTTKPSVRSSLVGFGHLPVGVSWEVGEAGRLDTEVGMHFVGYFGDVTPYGAVALSKGF